MARDQRLPIPGIFRGFQRIGGQANENLHNGKDCRGSALSGKFREAAKTLEAAGHVVLNPATLPDGLTDGDYMRIALAMLEASDLAVFLPDYQESRGAMVEWAWCQRTGKECALYLEMTGGRTK